MPKRDETGPAWAGGDWNCKRGGIMPGCWAGRTFSREDEREMLDARLKMIKTQEDAIKKRLGELGF